MKMWLGVMFNGKHAALRVFQGGLFCLLSTTVAAQGYSIGPLPDWVSGVEAPSVDWVKRQSLTNGTAHLLVDRQWKVEDGGQQYYGHYVTQALSAAGVEAVSQIAIEFDPTYESLTLHKVAIIRDGVPIDRLGSSRINLIQRERGLENQLYDGSKTLNVILEDVRPGDVVDYSFSISGVNPIFSGRFSKTLSMQWSVPVGLLHYRLLWPASVPLQIKNYRTDIGPILTNSKRHKEYIWRVEDLEALISDKGTPNWYAPYGKVFLSDMADWHEVVEWALPLYLPMSPDSKALLDLIESLKKQAGTDEARVLQALRFVQEQIRYLGIESGVNSHLPSAPDEVIKRRYGDCKDKSRLLVALLRGMGIESAPALVNTESGPLLANMLPSPTPFDHVIVRVRLDGSNYWLDPTRTFQKGRLADLYQPDYDYALVVSKDAGGLLRMSDDITAVHRKTVVETFDLSKALELPASYTVVTEYEHYYADSMREELAGASISALQQSYLNYTARYYPTAETAEPLSIREDEERNSVTVTESYRIPGVWQSGDDERYLNVTFEPFLIDDHVHDIESPKRTAPYAVTHPVKYRHITRVLVPKESTFEREYHEVLDSAFRFTKRVNFENDVLEIEYLYESLADHLSAADIAQHSRNIREVRKLSIFQIKMLNPSFDVGQERSGESDINWLMVGITGSVLIALLVISFKYIYRYDPPYRPQAILDSAPEGLSGWLILPGISLLLTPLRVAWETRELMYVFSSLNWSMLADQYGTGFLVLIVLEVISNMAIIVFGIFLIPMFITRRHTFPRLYISFYLIVVVLTSADLLAIHLVQIPGLELDSADINNMVRVLFSAVIWSLYFLRSKRVKATFTRSRGGIECLSKSDPLPQT